MIEEVINPEYTEIAIKYFYVMQNFGEPKIQLEYAPLNNKVKYRIKYIDLPNQFLM